MEGGWQDDYATRTARVNEPSNLTGASGSCNAAKNASVLGEGEGQWVAGCLAAWRVVSVALLHQHQRTRQHTTTPDGRRVAFIEATVADVALANRLAHEVLGRSLDELPPGTRRLLDVLDDTVATRAAAEGLDPDQVRFTRRAVRETTAWGDIQLKVHLGRLVELELVIAHRAERGAGFVYELAWAGPAGTGNGS